MITNMVHPNISPLVSLSVTQQNKFLLCWNRTNSWCRNHMYISICFFPLYVVLKIGLSIITSILIHIYFLMLLLWHWIIFYTLFWCRIRKIFILKVYIYIPCINTQRKSTAPFDDTPIISPLHSEHSTTGVYHVYLV